MIAAGLGTRLRPLTARYPKPVLPIDGRPVLASLLRELAEAGCETVTVVTGHLAEQVERLGGDGRGFGLELRYARQASPDGSTDAVLAAGAQPPYLVLGADTLFAPGDVGRFAAAWSASGAAGALALVPEIRHRSGSRRARGGGARGEGASRARRSGRSANGSLRTSRPGREVRRGSSRPAFQQAIDAGERIAGIEIGPTRGLTTPVDLIRENFPYLRQL